ncbi:MAG TPA: hemolysin family protein [Acidimicrobiales bacterium]|jgi:putative hemolysin|nr:hemolysin family protein [Acidimicrobiales bacterium]
MTTSQALMLAAVAALVLLAAFFAMSETSLTRISRVKAITMEEEGRRGAARLARLVEHPERFLNPILLLVLVCHLVVATLVGALAQDLFGALGVTVAVVFEVVVIFVLAESAPKTWAVQHTERAALLAAPLISFITNLWPVRQLARGLIGLSNWILPGKGLKAGPFVSEEELLATVDVATEDEVIEHDERRLIHSIIEFGDTVVREVMVPRPDMVAVEGKDKVDDVVEVAIAAGFSRIPVYDQGIDDVVGIVFVKDLMRAEREGRTAEEVRNLVREAHFVPETKRVTELLREMQRGKFHIAVVVDEYGGTAGLVTLEDLIEELVGEIVDEFDVEEPGVEDLGNGEVRVNARMPIDEVNELLGADLPTGDWDSVGGLVFNLLGHVPIEGEAVEVDGHRLVAEKVQGRRIGRVRISKVESPAPASAE